MFDKNNLLKLLAEFLHSVLKGSFSKIILIQDDYFCIPEELTNEKIILEAQNDSPYYIISHQTPVKRDIIKKKWEDQLEIEQFILVYRTTEHNDQFLDELKYDNLGILLTPINLIKYWLGDVTNIDNKFDFLSFFVWHLKDFIINNRDKILRIKSLDEDQKFKKITEIVLKNTFPSLIEKGKLINLMDYNNSWKLKHIFLQKNYILKKLFKIFKEEIEIDEDLFNYIKSLVLFEIEYKDILKIFLIAHFLLKLDSNLITNINFSSFIDEFIDLHDAAKKDSIKSLNRSQIMVFSEIFENNLINLKKNKSKDDLIIIISLIKELGDVIEESSSLREITIETTFLQGLDIYEKCLKLSRMEYFYYLPLKISELFFDFFTSRIHDLSRSLESDDGGRIKKVADNINNNNMVKIFKDIDSKYEECVAFYNNFYELCYGLFTLAFYNANGFPDWDFIRWAKFYSDFYVKVIKNLDKISKIRFPFNNFNRRCTEIVDWFFLKFNELEILISAKFFDFIKLKYPEWIQHFHDDNICPLLTANVFERFISRDFRRRPVNHNFIFLIDGCTLDNWRNIKSLLKKDFKEYEFNERIGSAIIPTQTWWSRRAIFAGDLMRNNIYFRSGEANCFKDLLQIKYHIYLHPGRDDEFFNTHCENRENFNRVKENIETLRNLPQIIIFNFSDLLEEDSFDRVDVKEIIEHTFYPKIKELIELILKSPYNRPNIFFLTDHGIIRTKENVKGLNVIDTLSSHTFSLNRSLSIATGRKAPRLVQLAPNYILNLNVITTSERQKFLVIDDFARYGLIGDRYDKMFVASSHYTFTTQKKAHGGISMAEMIIPFARMLKKPSVSRNDFTHPIVRIENKEEFGRETNKLKISILNENSRGFTRVKLHLITKNSHQTKKVPDISANTMREVVFNCNDKGLEPIKVKLDYYYQFNKFTYAFEFELSLEDYSEELESGMDVFLDDEF